MVSNLHGGGGESTGGGGEVAVVDADSGDVIAVADDGGLGVEGVVYYLILKF